ncbi:MAG: ABC transporter permease [Kofleriaceae bacterium]
MSALAVIAALTVRRVLRGRILWASALVALLPVGFAYIIGQRDESAIEVTAKIFAFELLVLAVLPALFVAASMGEEIEDRTTTYLWSRPVPRWAVPAGKLVAMVPMIWVISLASWTLALVVGAGELPSASSYAALLLGSTALSIVAAAIAILVPRHGMALTICYMLFLDLSLGIMPAAIRFVSVTQHARAIAGLADEPTDSPTSAVIGIAAIAAIWAIVGLARIRRLES